MNLQSLLFWRRRPEVDAATEATQREVSVKPFNVAALEMVRSDISRQKQYETRGTETTPDEVQTIVQDWINAGHKMWAQACEQVSEMIKVACDKIDAVSLRLTSEREQVVTTIAGLTSDLRQKLKGLCTQEIETKAKNQDEARRIRRRIRELQCMMFGDPDQSPPSSNGLHGAIRAWAPLIVVGLGCLAVEFVLVLDIFQSASNLNTAKAIAIGIASIGIVSSWMAAGNANLSVRYRDALARRNRLCKLPRGTLETGVVDSQDGFIMDVAPPGSGHRTLTYLMHAVPIVLAAWVLYARIHILLNQPASKTGGSLVTQTIVAGVVLLLWLLLYLLERHLKVFRHPSLREHRELTEKLAELEAEPEADDEKSFAGQVEEAVAHYRGACASAKAPLIEGMEVLHRLKSTVTGLQGDFANSVATFSGAFNAVVMSGCLGLVENDPDLGTNPALDLRANDGALLTSFGNLFTEGHPQLSNEAVASAQRARAVTGVDVRPESLGEIIEVGALLTAAREEAQKEFDARPVVRVIPDSRVAAQDYKRRMTTGGAS